MKNINLNFENAMKTVVALAVSALSIACTSCDEKDDIIVPNYKLTLEVDGDIVKDTTVAEGTLVNLSLFDGLADKDMTAEFTYVFAGWEYLGETVKSVVVNEDMTVEAKYDEVVNKYDVTFVIEDELVEYAGTDLVQSIAYNGKVKFPEFECPKHVSYAWYDESGAMVEYLDNVKVSGDATYTAKCGGEKTSSVVVKFEGIEKADTTITFAWDEEKTYDAKIAKLGDLDVEGYEWVFDNDNNVVKYTINTYEVKFYDVDGNELESYNVDYDKSAEAPYANNAKSFWDTDFSSVKSDLTIKAKYAKTITIHEVEYTVLDDEKDGYIQYSNETYTYYVKDSVTYLNDGKGYDEVNTVYYEYDEIFEENTYFYRYPEADADGKFAYRNTNGDSKNFLMDAPLPKK